MCASPCPSTRSPARPPPPLCRGIIRVRQLGAWAVATYSVVWGLVVAAGVAGDAWLLWTGRGSWRRHGRVGSKWQGRAGGGSSQEGMLPQDEGSAGEAGSGSVEGGGGPAQAV